MEREVRGGEGDEKGGERGGERGVKGEEVNIV